MSRRLVRIVAIGLLVLLALAAGGGYLVFGPNTPAYEDARGVKVYPGAAFEQVLDSLDASGVLAQRGTLAFLADATGWGRQVKAGYYEFDAGASNYAILNTLRKGLQTAVRVTVPPGATIERIAAVSGRRLAAGPEGMLAALRSDSLADALGVKPEALIGYLLPDTYKFFWLTPPATVVARIKETYDDYLEEHGPPKDDLSPTDIASVASIVEWETARDAERATVAGVYLNRLRRGMLLQADPTVQYAILELEGQKRRLFFADYRLAHPYNTYLVRGLPPGPVTNPSRESIRAVLDPEDHEFLYFVAKGDGGHTFSKTLSEHNRAAQAFYALMRERRAAQAAE